MSVGVKPEPAHNRRISSDSRHGSVGSIATPSPSSTPSSHHSPKAANLMPGPSTQSVTGPDDALVVPEDDDLTIFKGNGSTEEEEPIDCDSKKGIFGWDTVDETSIPYLLRRKKKFVSVRIVECKLLSKYPNTIPEELAKKDPMVSHFITEAEANLLNEINTTHCDYEYGHTPFTDKDLLVDLEEFLEFFKIVKKNFPEDMLVSMNADMKPPDPIAPTPPASEPSQYCGWVQINNTVSPYIVRSDGKVKLVPLSVIVYAAGLLSGSRIEGILPTIEECTMLNAACKTAGFDFTFGRNTRLIAITEVVQRCQVQIFELPMSNPLQYAQYLDGRCGPQPPPSSILTSSLRPPPPYPNSMVQYGNSMGMESAMLQNQNPFLQRYLVPPRLPGGPSPMPSSSGPPNANISRIPAPNSGIGMDAKTMSASMHPTMAEKLHNFDSKIMGGNPPFPPLWSVIKGQAPPPARKPIKGMNLPQDMPPPLSSSAPSSSSYQPMSLPPSPLLHPTAGAPNISLPIHLRNSGVMAHKEGRYPPTMTGNKPSLPQPPLESQYSTPSSPPFGINQFKSSLFARTESSDSHKQRPPISSSSPSSFSHPSYPQIRYNNIQTSPLSHMLNSAPNPSSKNTQNPLLVKNISACLVNGKSISCLNMNSPSRRGKYCLVEAVSKLYFPTIPIMEFVKVLKMVLMANLYECSQEEEAAFVQYYNLPVPKLKCNLMITVDDLQNYFPQLNYVFNKRLSDQQATSEATDGGVKRPHGSAPSGPPAKHSMPRLENVVQKLHQDKRPSADDLGGPSHSGPSSSVIVIDD